MAAPWLDAPSSGGIARTRGMHRLRRQRRTTAMAGGLAVAIALSALLAPEQVAHALGSVGRSAAWSLVGGVDRLRPVAASTKAPRPASGPDPFDDARWKNRKFDWAFTQTDEDSKLSDLPRPAFLPEWFWEWFYEKGVFIAVAQGALLIGGLAVFFTFLPYVLNDAIRGLVSVAPKT
mmetsp:Transcript_96729/g.273267  ORF Transcript_96729/g.273267 Transcript_96729/m.273267 type:complete len:177 (+) Transcript_96729:41-571(+)